MIKINRITPKKPLLEISLPTYNLIGAYDETKSIEENIRLSLEASGANIAPNTKIKFTIEDNRYGEFESA